MKRLYICHTFYHSYIALLRELLGDARGQATLLLSTMSNNFSGMKERTEKSGIFRDVHYFEEQPPESSPELMELKMDRGSQAANLLQRIRYTKKLARLQEAHLPVRPKDYDEVYLFCDSDPIGYYLNYRRIPYHACEDGLNTGKLENLAMFTNRGAWGLKKLMASLGLIHIENGYSRYCIDYIVNDISVNYLPPKNAVEYRVSEHWEQLSAEDHELLARVFVEKLDTLRAELRAHKDKPSVMILTEPLCDYETRKRLFGDLIGEYGRDHHVILKPHPRDTVDYAGAFPDITILSGRFPMEVINDIPDLAVDKLVSVITQVDNIRFAKEVVYLGEDFLDRYEDPSIHRKIPQDDKPANT